LLLFTGCLLTAASPVFAALLPACAQSGNCQLTDAVQMAVNIADFIVKILGTTTLIFFIYGGFTWLTSAGRSEQVKKGQEIIIGAIIGLIIVLSAYAAIKFLEDSLGIQAGFHF